MPITVSDAVLREIVERIVRGFDPERIILFGSQALDLLRDGLPTGWVIAPRYPRLLRLTDWAVEARYPRELPDATDANAEPAISVAQDSYSAVVRGLASHGFVV